MKLSFLKYASEGCAAIPGWLIGIGTFNQFRLGYDLHISNGIILFLVYISLVSVFATGTTGSASKIIEWLKQSSENRKPSKNEVSLVLMSLAFLFVYPLILLYTKPVPSDVKLVWGPNLDVISFLKAPLSELLIPIGISIIPAVLFGGLYWLSIRHKTAKQDEPAN